MGAAFVRKRLLIDVRKPNARHQTVCMSVYKQNGCLLIAGWRRDNANGNRWAPTHSNGRKRSWSSARVAAKCSQTRGQHVVNARQLACNMRGPFGGLHQRLVAGLDQAGEDLARERPQAGDLSRQAGVEGQRTRGAGLSGRTARACGQCLPARRTQPPSA